MDTPQGHPGINRYGEERITPDYYDDESGMRHSRVPDLDRHVNWSSDPRSEASHERNKGKGPRNFSRSDELLREKVCEVFLKNPDLDPEFIDVAVSNGVVTLSGQARIREDRYLAEELARDVSGVTDIQNLISRRK